ncbi:MAG: type II secretion system protein [Planctomycetota bacterium]
MRRRSGGGFTLVEVLVVVGIIGILAGLLFPVFRSARSAALLTCCRSRLRQWGVAFDLYALQNDGFFPHTDGLDRDNGPPDRFGWVDVLPPLMDETPWREHARGKYPGPETIFQCPAAALGPEDAYSYRPRRNGYFSYAMNSCLELDHNCWRAPGDAGVPMPSFLRRNKIVNPTRVILLFDQLLDSARAYGDTGSYRSAGKHCGSYPKAFAARHAVSSSGLGGCILFCDFHVEWRASVWKPDWPADLEVPPRDDPDWFPYPPDDG